MEIMKIKLLIFAFFLFGFVAFSQTTAIPDPNFEQYLIDGNVDNTGILDGQVPTNRILLVTGVNVYNKNISSLTGIEAFLNLTSLNCRSNTIASLNINDLIYLTNLDCSDNNLTSLNVNQNVNLISLRCNDNALTTLNVSQNLNLTTLYCSGLSGLNVTQNLNLISLYCVGSTFTSLNVSQNTALQYLNCNSSALTALNVSNNLDLRQLICAYCPIASLNVAFNTLLGELQCQSCLLTSLDVSHNLSLTRLWCGDNVLNTLNVTLHTQLQSLRCYNINISSLNVTTNTQLTDLDCDGNLLTTLNLTQNTALRTLNCLGNLITNLNLSANTVLYVLDCSSNPITNLNLSANTSLYQLTCSSNNLLASIDLRLNINLRFVAAYNNAQLTNLDVRNGQNAYMFLYTSGCPNLSCILVDNPALAATYNWQIDSTTSYISVPSNCINYVAPPAVVAQNFCNTATVANLIGSGTALKWYVSNIGGLVLSPATILNTATYYVSQTVNNIESERTAVLITINTTLLPTAAAQSFCNTATVASLTAGGTAIKWYATETGGTPLVATTPITLGTYYVSQTLNSCESNRTAVVVTIYVTPLPTAVGQAFCNAATVANLTAGGTAIKWYANATGGAVLFANIALTSGTYYVSQTLNACESTRTAVVVTINTTAAPITNPLTLCNNNGVTTSNLFAIGTELRWYANLVGGVVLLPSAPVVSGTYYVSQTLNDCESARSAVAVIVKPTTALPTVAPQTFCDGATVANLVANGTSLQWYASLTSNTSLAATTILTTATYYVSQLVNGCYSNRKPVAITINTTAPPTATAQTLCNGATLSNLIATGTLLKWYANSTGGTALTATLALTSATYYVSQTLNGCESARTAVAININTTAAPTALPQTFCNTAIIANLIATGTMLQWYANATGGIALAFSTTLIAGNYYVSQTLNGCESARTSVTISLTASPSIVYNTPNNYAVGTSISPLVPSNNGCLVLASIYTVSTLAGIGTLGSIDGITATASFNRPNGVAIDTNGTVYIADNLNNKVRKITTSGIVSTFAGSGTIGSADGLGTLASFNKPSGIAVDVSGNIYVADTFNNKIRKITPSGLVSTLAGIGTVGLVNGSAATASFRFPTGVAVDAAGVVYVADASNLVIRKITTAGIVSTLAGSGIYGFADGTAAAASFKNPTGIAVDASGNNIYVADFGDHRIRKITSAGVVITFAGDGTAGAINGSATNANFSSPYGVAVDLLNNVYVTDNYTCNIRKISATGIVSKIAGVGFWGNLDGAGSIAGFYNPAGIATDVSGNIYVADVINHKVRKISTTSYEISGILPAGLTFNPSTGIISGTPTTTSAATNYTVTAHNSAGSSSTIVNISVGTLSSDNFGLINNVKIYPNPNNGNFFIENTDITTTVLEIKISDLQGKIVFTKKTTSNIEEIRTNGLSQGVYVLSIQNGESAKSVHKLIIK